ncbi:TIGR04076 family protein [Selenomonas ruminantium]|uniref:TIGR04076 family protein n=1 Tax=Selenomonas ruminantium TaxID=971 RepID=UPI001C40B83E|nr:TIGR04076 family protein [Selenomonas ruminantium]
MGVKKVRITAVRKACYKDLIQRYENPIENACSIEEGQVFIAEGWKRPEGLCESAWESMSAFVMALSHGAEDFYEGWMKNPRSAMISCNDGFRPVSFLLEALDEEAE